MRFIKTISIALLLIVALIFGWFNLFISEQERELTEFNSIYTTGPINVYITQAKKESISIRSDSKLLDNLVTEVIAGQLRIYNEGRIQHERVFDVFVNYIHLDSIHASGQSTLTGKNKLIGTNLFIETSVSAELKLQLEVDSLNLVMDDHANVQLAGSATNFYLLISDVGDLMAYNLESQNCVAVVDTGDQSPGIARINVQKTLNASIIGPRYLKFKGEAVITNKIIQGAGKLLKH